MDSAESIGRIIAMASDRALATVSAGGGQGLAMLNGRGRGLAAGEALPQTLQYDETGTLQDGFRFGAGPGFGSRFLL